MAWIHVRQRVRDYNAWKEVYEQTSEIKRPLGWKRYQLFMVEGDRNDILLMEEFATAEGVHEYINSADMRAAMDRAGVIGAAEILILNGLESGVV
jgi:quinol monooxygenase YgiN